MERKKADPESPSPRRSTFDSIRDNLEALIVAVILAVIIRHFAVEAFEIPTGSMAPTLYGMHVELKCPNCSHEYAVAVQSNSSTGEIDTPFEERVVYEGECPNPDCTLALHGRAPRTFPQRESDRRDILSGGIPLPPLRRGDPIQCLGCATVFRGADDRFHVRRAVEVPARCPVCQHRYRAIFRYRDVGGGHKILVNKFAYHLSKPRRWDVIVFEFDQWKNYIKRLIGLPGEEIRIFDGDIYVNGKIARKADHPTVQAEMWRLAADSDQPESGLNEVPAWEEVGTEGSGFWTAVRKPEKGQRWSLTNLGRKQPAVLAYQRGFDNYVAYNLWRNRGRGDPEGVQVGDRKLAFTAVPVAAGAPRRTSSDISPDGRDAEGRLTGAMGGWLGAEIRDGAFSFQVRIPVGSASRSAPAVLERLVNEKGAGSPDPIRPPHETGLRDSCQVTLPLNKASRIELANVDDTVIVSLNGDTILALEYVSCPDIDNPPPPNGELHQALRILGADVQVEVASVQVYLDYYYTSGRPSSGRFETEWPGLRLEAGQYLALGDNSSSSSDGRVWGYVPEKNLMGKAILVFWPAIPGVNFQWKLIR